jgi:NADPH2:quinone reductase
MKAAVLKRAGFSIEEVAPPSCGPGEILVRTQYCGICEGDLAAFRRVTAGEADEGVVLGHEGTGVVVDLDASIEGFARGDTVTALGGSYSEYFIARSDQLVKLPATVASPLALGEPVACCVHGAWRSGVRIGDRVAIVGCGFMGLVWMQLVALQGAAQIEAFDMLDWRLDAAIRLGADKVHSPDYGSEEEFDVVVEAAGTQGALDLATRLVRQHGRLIIVAYHQANGGGRNISMKTWNFKAIDVVNAHVRNHAEKLRAMESAILLMGKGKIRMQELVTEYRLADVAKAFDDLLARKRGLFKAELAPS